MKLINSTYVDKLFFEIASVLDDINADIEPENLSALKTHIENCLIANGEDLHASTSYEEACKAVSYFTECVLADQEVATEAKQDVLAIQRAFKITKYAA